MSFLCISPDDPGGLRFHRDDVATRSEDTPRRTNARLLVAAWRPHHSDARRDLRDLAKGRRIAWIACIPREHQPGGRLRMDGAVDVLAESCLIEMTHLRIRVLHGQERLPAEPEIHRQVGPEAPVVLRVRANVVAVVVAPGQACPRSNRSISGVIEFLSYRLGERLLAVLQALGHFLDGVRSLRDFVLELDGRRHRPPVFLH